MKYFLIYIGLAILGIVLALVPSLLFGALLMLVWNVAVCTLFPSFIAMNYGIAVLIAWGISIVGTLLKGIEIKYNA